jgi:hypothetical protein
MGLKRFARVLCGCLAAALLLAVPVFAVRALTPGTQPPGVAIDPADDLEANGFRIVHTAPPSTKTVAPETRLQAPAENAVQVLHNWTYTGHPKPSPHH